MSISIYEIIHWLIFVFPFFPPSVKLDLPKKDKRKIIIEINQFEKNSLVLIVRTKLTCIE